jgi:AraC-like DNA-binding protein
MAMRVIIKAAYVLPEVHSGGPRSTRSSVPSKVMMRSGKGKGLQFSIEWPFCKTHPPGAILKAQTAPFSMSIAADSQYGDAWRERFTNTYGLDCQLLDGNLADMRVSSWSLGKVGITTARFTNLRLLPMRDDVLPRMKMTIVMEGTMHVESRGRLRTFNAGDAVLTDSSSSCRQSFIEPAEILTLCFRKETLDERGFRSEGHGIFAPDATSPDVRAVIDLIAGVAAQKGAPSLELRRRQGDHFVDLLELFLQNPKRVRSSDAAMFRAMQFIERHLCVPDLTPARIAAAAHVSDAHLDRLFRAKAGQSVMRYLLSRRLERAARSLMQKGPKQSRIGEIAHDCGFISHSHFSRAFKNRYGVTPKELAFRHESDETEAITLVRESFNAEAS